MNDYGTVRVTAGGFRDLVNAHFPHDPDVLAIGSLVADELRQDLAARGLLTPASSIEGCPLVIDGALPADGWELRHGDDVLASGRAPPSGEHGHVYLNTTSGEAEFGSMKARWVPS